MKNIEIATIFNQMADILEFLEEVPFKINAYRKAARAIEELTTDIVDVWKNNALADIPGVGKALQAKIEEYLQTGQIPQYNELLTKAPKELFELLNIQSFGPKTAALAYKQLHVETVDDLLKVAESGELAKLSGMGAKKVENILKSIELYKTARERISIGIAWPIFEDVKSYLMENAGSMISRISSAGSVRRFRETVHDIDVLVETDDGPGVIEAFTKMPAVTRILGAGETKASVILNDRFQVDLRAVRAESFGAALQYFTGSQAHNVRLREIAKKKGLKINEYGIFRENEKLGGENEEDIYRLLNMPCPPAELREDRGEIDALIKNELPDLVQLKDIRADLHIHSTYSDGQLALKDMAEHVRQLGYSHMSFNDHSQSVFYANGCSIDRLYQQMEEIRTLNKEFSDFTILTGTEVDIMPDGSVDFPDDILKQLDFVVASIHSAFKTNPTERILSAMENPYVDVIGHPTGRLISRREGYELDMDRVIKKASETGTALEVNSFWDRLDISDLNIRKAIENNVKISINTDSHHPKHLTMMELGVGTARRGWATKNDVINTLSLPDLKKWQKRNRQ